MPTPTTFGAWMELRPGLGRQPDPSFYAEFLEAAAARTSRIQLGTGVLLLPLYRPRDVAEQAGVVDLIAGGRLVLGLGNGYVEQEFDAFDTERPRRGQLMEEKLAYLRRAFREGVAADGPDG